MSSSWSANNNVPPPDPGSPTPDAPPVRPMGPADYRQGTPTRPARKPRPAAAATAAIGDHPWRDVLIGATITALALWAVPKGMEALLEHGIGPGEDEEEYEFEVEE
jgi:hypothetical protein